MIIDKTLFGRIKEKKKRLDSLRPLPPSLVSRLRDQIIIEWTYNSNAIEGTRLSLRETQLILEQGLTIKGKTLREHLEAINHKEAIIYLEEIIQSKKATLNNLFIRQIHGLILKGIDDENAGKYREVEVRITGSPYKPPLPSLVPVEMNKFSQWLSRTPIKKNDLDYAALAHFKLVHIHPFIDGNGRTARLIMNLILMKKGYPPTVILKTDRSLYYKALDEAHKGDCYSFVSFIGKSVERSLTWYLEAVIPEREKARKEKWMLLSKLAPNTPYSQEYLSFLARLGKIEAVKKGRNWYSHKKAIDKYQKE